jgi:hypothetical protein
MTPEPTPTGVQAVETKTQHGMKLPNGEITWDHVYLPHGGRGYTLPMHPDQYEEYTTALRDAAIDLNMEPGQYLSLHFPVSRQVVINYGYTETETSL